MNRTVEHCLVAGPLGTDGDVEASLRGDAFDVSLRRYTLDETREGGLDGLGEEVATVLSGQFDVDAAGEQYTLVSGEGIIIPRGEPRLWRCTSVEGVLYRAIVRSSDLGEVAS